MQSSLATLAVALLVCCPSLALARQNPDASPQSPIVSKPQLFEEPKRVATGSGFWAPFAEVPRDFVRFMSVDTARVAGFGAVAAIAAHPMDDDRLVRASSTSALKVGNLGGQFLTHIGISFGTYAAGRIAGSNEVASFGGDLMRAQILSQGIVQAGKMLTTRTRPDGSNNHSLPSGHTASTFATATVIQRHFGWKAGVPAYAFGAYVAASRMGENRHYLSDVLMGAALGIAAGRTVTVDAGGAKFDLGVAPAAGGAAVTFTKR